MRPPLRHVILDRDGVLNAEPGDGGYVTDWAQWRWLPGALESLVLLHAEGVCISVATNQSCVGRGIFARDRLDAIHACMLDEVAQAGGAIDHLFVCPHAPGDLCDCRKPSPGLLRDAIEASGILRPATVAVGDDLRDLQAAEAVGIPAVLVRTGKGTATEAAMGAIDVPVFDDLRAFTAALLSDSIASMESRTP